MKRKTDQAPWETLLEKAIAAAAPSAPQKAGQATVPWREGEEEYDFPRFTRRGPKALVFLKPDSLGDLIVAEPLFRLLRNAWPSTAVHIVTFGAGAALKDLLPEGLHWHVAGKHSPFAEPTREGLTSLREVLKTLPREAWLVSACARKTWWDRSAPSLVRFDRLISLNAVSFTEAERRLLENSGLEGPLHAYVEVIPSSLATPEWKKNQEIAAYLLGAPVPDLSPRLKVNPEFKKQAQAWLAQAGLNEDRFVACCPAGTANIAIKTWPSARYAEVLAQIENERGLPVLILGSANEKPLLQSLVERLEKRGKSPRLWVGERPEDWHHLCALLELAGLYLGNDTGPMHAAAALGLPVVGIFGGGTWPRFVPKASRAAAVVHSLPCFGCDWQCIFGDAPCLGLVQSSTVLGAVAQVLDNNSTTGTRCVEEKNERNPAIDRLVLGALQHSRSLQGLIDHLDKTCREQTSYLHTLESFRSETEGLRPELQRLQTIVTEQTSYLGQLEKEKLALQSALAERDQRFKTELERLSAEVTKENQEKKQLWEKQQVLEAEHRQSRLQLEETRQTLAAAQNEYGKALALNETLHLELAALAEQLTETRQTKADLEGTCRSENAKNESLHLALAESNKALEHKFQIIREQDALLANLRGEQSRLAAEILGLSEESRRRMAVIVEQNTYIAQLETERGVVETERKSLETEVSKLQTKFEERSLALASAKQEAERERQTQISLLKEQGADLEAHRTAMRKLEIALEANRENYQKHLSVVEEQTRYIDLLERQRKELEIALEKATEENRSLSNAKVDSEAKAASLQMGLAEREANLKLAEQEQLRLAEKLRENARVLACKEQDLLEAKNEAEKRDKDLGTLETALAKRNERLVELENRISGYQVEMAALRRLASHLEFQYKAASGGAKA